MENHNQHCINLLKNLMDHLKNESYLPGLDLAVRILTRDGLKNYELKDCNFYCIFGMLDFASGDYVCSFSSDPCSVFKCDKYKNCSSCHFYNDCPGFIIARSGKRRRF